jgi:hypothetical protein
VKVRWIIIKILFFLLASEILLAAEMSTDDKKSGRRSSTQILAMVSTWREESKLLRSDSNEYQINTLNVAGRLGLVHYFRNARYFLQYGFLVGHSESDSAVDDFAYFQRSVLVAGLEGSLGLPVFVGTGVEISLAMGGIYRMINHSIPSADYKFSTATRFLPRVAVELVWRLSQSVYWRQSIGSFGRVGDTLWSAGLGYDW